MPRARMSVVRDVRRGYHLLGRGSRSARARRVVAAAALLAAAVPWVHAAARATQASAWDGQLSSFSGGVAQASGTLTATFAANYLGRLGIAAGLPALAAATPPFTGNGHGVRLQGGTGTQKMYVTSGWAWSVGRWQGYCNQAITDSHGRTIGWYVDDQTNDYPGPPSSARPAPAVASGVKWGKQANCVAWDHKVYPGMLIIAGIGQWNTSWTFRRWRAVDAQEWYPVCGRRWIMGRPPRRRAFIMQWNYVWPWCGPTPRMQIAELEKQLGNLRPRPTLILHY